MRGRDGRKVAGAHLMTKWNDILLPWMRSRRRLMLIVAWLIWSLSLSAPAINFPNIVFLSDDLIRVRSLVLDGIVELSPVLPPVRPPGAKSL